MGKVKCDNKCKEIGANWRKQDEIRQRTLSAANKRRNELVTESARLRREVADRIKSLGEEIKGAELRAQGLEQDLAEIERRERTKVVKGQSGGGKLGVLTGLARDRINELRSNLIAIREERDSGHERVRQLEAILAAFKEEYNPNFNDEGVKTAVRAWEDYAASGRLPESDGNIEKDLDDMSKTDEENGLNWAEFERQEEGDVEVCKYCKTKAYLPGLETDFAGSVQI